MKRIPDTTAHCDSKKLTPTKAVVNRKVWGGNRTQRGADAQATLSTVLVTLAQQAIDPVQWLAGARQSVEPLSLER